MLTSLESNEKNFKEQIERLQKGLKGSYTKEQINILFDQVKRFKVDHLTKTVEHLLITKTFLPPANDIIAGCRVEAYGDEIKEDHEDKQFSKDFLEGKIKPKGEMGRESLKLILDKLNGKITIYQLYKKMNEMELRYPNIGWLKEATQMEKDLKNIYPQGLIK